MKQSKYRGDPPFRHQPAAIVFMATTWTLSWVLAVMAELSPVHVAIPAWFAGLLELARRSEPGA